VVAIIADALWKLGRTAAKDLPLAVLGVAVFVFYLLGVNELLLLGVAAIVTSVEANRSRILGGPHLTVVAGPMLKWAAATRPDQDLPQLFLLFLKFGAVVFGSGYVLLAFIRADLVSRLGWLTNDQLIDAVAIGQFTPGPVFTTATFIGYVVAGLPGALLATVAIFLPSFLLVAALNPLIPRIRRSPWLAPALDGLNMGSVGLMAGVAVQLAIVAIGDLLTAALALGSLIAIVRLRLNPAWVILLGGAVGLVRWAAM
jgi:chromate transporter